MRSCRLVVSRESFLRARRTNTFLSSKQLDIIICYWMPGRTSIRIIDSEASRDWGNFVGKNIICREGTILWLFGKRNGSVILKFCSRKSIQRNVTLGGFPSNLEPVHFPRGLKLTSISRIRFKQFITKCNLCNWNKLVDDRTTHWRWMNNLNVVDIVTKRETTL